MNHFDKHSKRAMIATCVMLIVCAVGFGVVVEWFNLQLRKEAVELRRSLASIPKVLSEWRTPDGMADAKLTAEIAEALGTKTYLSRIYVRPERGRQQRVDLHIAYYTGMIDAVPHVPDRCFVAAGWTIQVPPKNFSMFGDGVPWEIEQDDQHHLGDPDRPYYVFRDAGDAEKVIRLPIGELKLRVTEFSDPEKPDVKLFSGYLFIANGEAAVTPEEVRRKAFDLSSKHAFFAKVQFSMAGSRTMRRSEFVAATSDLMTELLPDLMLCLPDWAEVEPTEPGESSS